MYSATAPEHTGQRGSPPGEPANQPEPRSSPRSGQASLLRTVKVAQAPAPETPICSPELTRARTLITVQNGGYLSGHAKTQVTLRDRLFVSLRPRLAEFAAAD